MSMILKARSGGFPCMEPDVQRSCLCIQMIRHSNWSSHKTLPAARWLNRSYLFCMYALHHIDCYIVHFCSLISADRHDVVINNVSRKYWICSFFSKCTWINQLCGVWSPVCYKTLWNFKKKCVDPSSFSTTLLPISRWPAPEMDWFMLPVAESTQKTILTKVRGSRTGKFSVTDNFISGNTETSQGQQMGATGSSISWQAQEMFSKTSRSSSWQHEL